MKCYLSHFHFVKFSLTHRLEIIFLSRVPIKVGVFFLILKSLKHLKSLDQFFKQNDNFGIQL